LREFITSGYAQKFFRNKGNDIGQKLGSTLRKSTREGINGGKIKYIIFYSYFM